MFDDSSTVFSLAPGAGVPNFTLPSCSLEALWPTPNWISEIKHGMRADVASVISMIRAGLGQVPKTNTAFGITDAEWLEAYQRAVPMLRDLLMSSLTPLEATGINHRLASKLNTSIGALGKGHPRDEILFWAAGRGQGRFISPGSMTLQQQTLAKWMPRMGWPYSDASVYASIVPLEVPDSGWKIVRIEGNRYRTAHPDTFKNETHALATAIGLAGREFARDQPAPSAIPARSIRRIGPTWVQHGNVSIAMLVNEFGFRGVEFGAAVGKLERGIWLNRAFDAFADLADILSMPRKWIGLGGVLLAIGTRGTAEASSEPFDLRSNVIHLSKSQGAGSLAYRWWLAADFRLNRSISRSGRYLTGSIVSPSLFEELNDRTSTIVEMIKEMHGYIIPASEFHIQARAINGLRKMGNGWDRPERLFGRAFEAFIQDRLIAKDRLSPWLAYGTLYSDLDDQEPNPYPAGSERINLNMLFGTLMKFLITPD